MLPKSKRLNLKKDFKRVASGDRLETKYLKLFIKKDLSSIVPKVGIAVSSTLFKKATQRNKVRRVTSAAFEKIYPRLQKSLNIVTLPKRRLLDVKSQDVALDLESSLSAKGILL